MRQGDETYRELFHPDLGFLLPDPGQVEGVLQTQPVTGAGPTCLFEADGHLRRNSSVAIDDARESLARYPEHLCRVRQVQVHWIQAGVLDGSAGVGRVLHVHAV